MTKILKVDTSTRSFKNNYVFLITDIYLHNVESYVIHQKLETVSDSGSILSRIQFTMNITHIQFTGIITMNGCISLTKHSLVF